MPDIQQLARQKQKKRYKKWLKWGLITAATLVALPFIVAAVQMAMGDSPATPSQLGGPEGLPAASEEIIPEDGMTGGMGPGLSPQPPEVVRQAAQKYVQKVNENNPQGIIEYWVDGRANLYILFGAQVLTLPENKLVDFMDMQGRTWRGWVHDAIGQWPQNSDFAPGVVAVDTAGKWAQNINGKIAVFRCPRYPDVDGFRPACHIEPGEGQTVKPGEVGPLPE